METTYKQKTKEYFLEEAVKMVGLIGVTGQAASSYKPTGRN